MMQTCSACGHENQADKRFCVECGAQLETACPSCGNRCEPGERFCGNCGTSLVEAVDSRQSRVKSGEGGHSQLSTLDSRLATSPRAYTPRHLAEKILTARAALEGERKQVTVLFADVKGSMELAEQVDPEEWHRILDRFFQILTDGVHRFEGTVNQYTGDGIMALFGAPIAHEDHAQRACYAALHLREELRRYAQELRRTQSLDFHVRMGLNSGEVVVGKIGDDLRMDYTAQGHTVGLAQRMEQLAESGKVYLTEATAALVRGYVRLEDLGEFAVKGLSTPLRVYALEGVGVLRTRLDVSRARGLTRFVGRDADLQALDAALEGARQGNGQVVGVVGEPGVGKSRLCFEFVERCRAHGLTVIEGRAVAHGRDIPFLPMLQIFRAYFGITEQDTDRLAREKIAGRLVLLDESFREVLPLLFDFLGVPDPERPALRMDPEARQRQLFDILRRVVRGEQGDTVNLIEDLHWMDRGSEAFLAHWVEALGGSRGLLLVNFRPEYHAAWMQKSYYRQLPLAPLGPEAIRELLDHLLGRDPSVAGLAAAIHARTAGNPFFTEEVVQSLIESAHLQGTQGAYRLVTPIETLRVPPTVHALLASRIDRLAERDKQVLQTAAVIGKEFSESVLRAVVFPPFENFEKGGPGGICGTSELGARTQIPLNPPLLKGEEKLHAALRALTAAEFIYERELFPIAIYAFKHPLTQEVAYGSQLQERRWRTHAAVARAIEAAYAGKLDEQAALLAHHWEEAGEALEAARWYARAAAWAGASDIAAALRHWRHVPVLLRQAPETAETLRLGVEARFHALNLGWRLGLPEAEVEAMAAEGKALATRSGDPGLLALIVGAHGAVRGLTGATTEYLAASREALGLARQADDPRIISYARSALYWSSAFAGRFAEALALVDEELRELAAHRYPGSTLAMDSDPVCTATWTRGWFLNDLGRLDEAGRELARAEALARERHDQTTLAFTRGMQAINKIDRGEVEGALRLVQANVELGERIGDPLLRSIAYDSVGECHLASGRWEEARVALETALSIAHSSRANLVEEPFARSRLACACAGLGDFERARQLAREAADLLLARGTLMFAVPALLNLARVLRLADGATAAGEIGTTLDRTLALIDETGAEVYRPQVHVERAELARLLGDEAAYQRELREAHRLFVEIGATGYAESISRQLSAVSA